MLKNYFKIDRRNISRHKSYSGINILGLGITIIAIALTTVSFQSIKAAISNPVKSLRME